MAKRKKVTVQPEGNTVPIEPTPTEIETIKEELKDRPTGEMIVESNKPLFVDEKAETYRQLLLEHPKRPFIQNMQDAIPYFDAEDKWWNKVKLALQ